MSRNEYLKLLLNVTISYTNILSSQIGTAIPHPVTCGRQKRL